MILDTPHGRFELRAELLEYGECRVTAEKVGWDDDAGRVEIIEAHYATGSTFMDAMESVMALILEGAPT